MDRSNSNSYNSSKIMDANGKGHTRNRMDTNNSKEVSNSRNARNSGGANNSRHGRIL
jgi:hypothetical protein